MQDVTRQLESVRRVARMMLLAQVLLRWLAVVLAAALIAGFLDYALRLPGWLRLLLGVAFAAAVIVWLVRELASALGFRPGLSQLALRAERLYPQLSGALASGVEFAGDAAQFADSPRAAVLAQASIASLGRKLGGVSIGRLIDPRRTLLCAAAAALALLIFVGVAAAMPGPTWLAAQRWFAPLGSAEWPRRTSVASLVRERVWASDTPLRLRARIDRGYIGGMRTWVTYRIVSPEGAGAWQSLLMNDQSGTATGGDPAGGVGAGGFERLIDAPASRSEGESAVEFYFQAGDDQTKPQHLKLVERPAVVAVRLNIEPPAYAKGLVASQPISLDEQAGPIGTAAALEGSRVTLRFEFNKPLSKSARLDWAQAFPGLANEAGIAFVETQPKSSAERYAVEATFVVRRTVQTPLRVTDEFGLSSRSERVYRVEATIDQPPAVSVTQPVSDEAVLPTAVLPVEAMAQDDLAVESVALEAQKAAKGDAATTQPGAAPSETKSLTQTTGRANRLTAGQELELASLAVQPGDEVLLTGIAADVFDLDGKRHEPVRSSPRRLRVIDSTTLAAQLRSELGGVRQQAMRLEAQQRELATAAPEKALPAQQDIARRIDAQASVIKGLQERAARNRLAEPQLDELMRRAAELVSSGEKAAKTASGKLDEARRDAEQREQKKAEAEQSQADVGKALTDLISLLDQGRDTIALQLQIQQLMAAQEAVAGETRAALPELMGKALDQLTPEEKKKLGDLATKQNGLAGKADALARQMRSAAETLQNDKNNPQSQAAAKALTEAAAIAEQQGLQQTMENAAEQTKENKLSEAGTSQQSGMETMKQMLGQLGSQDKMQGEMLRRQLTALVDSIELLVKQQGAQIDRLKVAQTLTGFDASMVMLRRNTLAVAEEAKATRGGEQVAKLLNDAGGHQATAAGALRELKKDEASGAERLAMTSLEAALKEAKKLREEADEAEDKQQREELKAAYLKLVKEQKAIMVKSAPLAALAEPSRAERAEIIDFGHREADLQIAAQALGEKTKETLLFKHMHGQINAAALRVVERMRAAELNEEVMDDQTRIASMLQAMADALEESQKKNEFAKQQGSQGGGGGQSGGKPALVPPAAELKLLRGVQEAVYQRTKVLAERKATSETAARRERAMLELSTQQRDLAGVGQQLIDKMRQPKSGAPAPLE